MVIDEQEDEDDGIALNESSVLRDIHSGGGNCSDAGDPAYWRVEKDGKVTFIPKTYGMGGYTQAKLNRIIVPNL